MAELRQLHIGSPDRPALVFVHGLGGHPIDTWRHPSLSADNCWPHWVGRDTGCDVWLMGYDAGLSAWQAQAMRLLDQADQMADLLANKPGLRGRRLILVGHSLGGLVIKAMLVNVRTKGDASVASLAERTCGVVFIATPHTGSELATLARAVRVALRTNEQVGDMAIHDAALRNLNQQFKAAVQQTGLQVKVFAETHGVPIRLRIWKWWTPVLRRVVVVDPNSSDLGLPGVTAVRLGADHFSICKPERADQQIHDSLTQFVRTVANVRAASTVPVTKPEYAQPLAAIDMTLLSSLRQAGRLEGPKDNRLQPREGRLYGRDAEVAQVLEFLRGAADAAVVTAKEVAGVGGIGKTEVCKAALKAWLGEQPHAMAYFVDVPDRAGASELIERLAVAVGAQGADTLAQLLTLLPDALYYLDNLESVAEQETGREALKALRDRPGVRLLVSSRVSLPALLGKPIVLDVLPADAALRLFRELWAGSDSLPDAAELGRFVAGQLGNHALSVTLAARLGDCHAYPELVQRWQSVGAGLATDPQDRGRLGSLVVSLRLTAEALLKHEDALEVWTVAALFVDGIPDGVLAQLEGAAGWSSARPWLVRHHILVRRDDRWHMLPPLARYALDASLRREDGFDWSACGGLVRQLFTAAARRASSIASTDDSLGARAWLLAEFGTLVRLLVHEIASALPDRQFLQQLHDDLVNVYQFQAAVSRELLYVLNNQLERPASALHVLGDLERRLGRVDEARGLYDRALVLFERQQDGLGQANALKSLGDLESRLGRVDEARALYERALAFFERQQAGVGQANTLKALGDLQRRLGHLDEARALYHKALALFEQERDGLGQANTLQSLGDLEKRLGRVAEARGLYDRALALYEREQAGLGQANTLQSLGDLESRLDRVDEARAQYARALAVFEREQDGLGQANTLRALGEIEIRLGRTDEARGLYDRALALYERVQAGLGQASTLRALGDLEVRLGRVNQAQGLLERALAIFVREQNGLGQANALQSLGDLFRRALQWEDAATTYRRALQIYARERDPMGAAYTFAELARCLQALHDAGSRDEAMAEALEAAGRCGVPDVMRYVRGVLTEMTGSVELAQDWIDRRGLPD